MHHSTLYYPEGNRLVEPSDKSLIKVIKKVLKNHKRKLESHMKYVVLENRVSSKRATSMSPFELVYGNEAIFPNQVASPVMNIL